MKSAELVHRTDQQLLPDKRRVIARLFLPGEELGGTHSRVGLVVTRVLALPEEEVARLATDVRRNFSRRHQHLRALLRENSERVASHVDAEVPMSEARAVVMGAAFTAEFAVEGAALCNPSVVIAPDQSGLAKGQLRVVLSVRGIGEGHLSSLGFATAVVGPGQDWAFEARALPLVVGAPRPAAWLSSQFRAVLEHDGALDDLAHSVLAALPERFAGRALNEALASVHPDLARRMNAPETLNAIRLVAASAYEMRFPSGIEVSQRLLFPAVAQEQFGIEDARFVRFQNDDGGVEYRATYTAFNGHDVAPRLIVSPDLLVFRTCRLVGPAAFNKGMAFFPRKVNGDYLALCRTDGESTTIARSQDGVLWDDAEPIHGPRAGWELLQVGNCGSPIELDAGWLVLTHGVGPMRTYAIGAMLLDLDDPSRIVARLEYPLLSPNAEEREGYVPNVVYTCGGLVHEGILWLPYGIGDARIGVAWVTVQELLNAMTPTLSGR